MSLLEPDRYFSRISQIDIKRDLLDSGLRFALLDIDNTILTRDTRTVPRDVGVWLGSARDAGVTFCLLSNNWHEEVLDLAKSIDLPIVRKAMKPLPHGYLKAMSILGAHRSETVAIGDQLSTDVVGAHLLGIKAYLVAPLVEQDLAHTVVIRKLERAILGNRQPEGSPGAAIQANQKHEGLAEDC